MGRSGYMGDFYPTTGYVLVLVSDTLCVFYFAMQSCFQSCWSKECSRGGDVGIHCPLVWAECCFQPSEQGHLQLFPIPMVCFYHPCCRWGHLLHCDVCLWSKASLLWKANYKIRVQSYFPTGCHARYWARGCQSVFCSSCYLSHTHCEDYGASL